MFIYQYLQFHEDYSSRMPERKAHKVYIRILL